MLSKRTDDSLIRVLDLGKPCRVTTDTEASLTITRPGTVAGHPERKLSQLYVLQMASGETIPVLNEAMVDLTLGWSTVKISVFIAESTEVLILGLDVLQANDTSIDLGHYVLCHCRNLKHSHDHPVRCERMVTAQLEGSL